MTRYISIALVSLFTFVAILTVTATLFPEKIGLTKTEKPLVLGVFPRRHQAITLEIFAPLKNCLAKKLNRNVQLVSSSNFKQFWEGVKARKYDIVHYNQYHYLLSRDFGYEVLAMNEELGKSSITGSVIVRKDSGINSIQDLRGRRILFGGGPQSMQSYIYTTYLLKQGGLTEDDYEVQFANNSPSAVVHAFLNLYNVSAVGAGDSVLEMPIVTKQIDVNQLKILSRGERFAHYPWAIKTELDTELKLNIQKILTHLSETPQGIKALGKAELTGIVRAVDSDFDPHRHIVREVLGEVY